MVEKDVRMEFWDREYEKEVTGVTETLTARKALDIFIKNNIRKVIDVGCGIGQDSMYFVKHGLVSHGIDFSSTAIEKAKKSMDRKATFENIGVFEASIPDGSYEGVYCSKVLHQFRKAEIEVAIKRFFHWLKNGGIVVLAVLSAEDQNFGIGEKIEEGTFLREDGRTIHYFTENELKDALSRHGFQNIKIEKLEEFGRISDRDKVHKFLFASAKKVVIYGCNKERDGDARKVQKH